MLRLYLVAALALLALGSPLCADSLPAGLDPSYDWYPFTDPVSGFIHYYALTHSYGTWEACRQEALDVIGGGDLVVINTYEENDFLNNTFADLTYTQGHFGDPWYNIAWIGLWADSKAASATWSWVDGTPLTDTPADGCYYFRWPQAPAQPAGHPQPQPGRCAYLQLAYHPGEDGNPGASMWNANDWHETDSHGAGHPLGIIESKIYAPEPAAIATLCLGAAVFLLRQRRA
jgi:hypothetical protein